MKNNMEKYECRRCARRVKKWEFTCKKCGTTGSWIVLATGIKIGKLRGKEASSLRTLYDYEGE
jgi:predicted ATP-dependent serine protease